MCIISIIKLIKLSYKFLIANLAVEKITIFKKYLDFANVFFLDFVAKLSKHFKRNNYFRNLAKGKQPLYKPIYSLAFVKFEILKTYIKVNLTNNFIKSLKLLAGTFILYFGKKNNSF